MRESSKFVAPWRKQVVAAAQAAMAEHPGFETILSPVLLHIDFHNERPKSHYRTGKFSHILKDSAPLKWKQTMPDLSKLIRSTEDGITTSGLWKDDNLVASLQVNDLWSDWSGCIITIETLEN